jgi:hypothetical protein
MLMAHSNHAVKLPLRLVGDKSEMVQPGAPRVNPIAGSDKLDEGASGQDVPSQEEIERRILAVRSSWGLQERILRRHAAEERFERLVETLSSALQ